MDNYIFITGARGFLGRNLLEVAEKQFPNSTFILLVRKKEDLKKFNDRFRIVQGDITLPRLGLNYPDFMAFSNANEVWHLAASTSFDDKEKDTIYQSNVVGTKNVLSLSAELKKLNRFMYVSTAYVAGTSAGPISEDSLPEKVGFRNSYEETKWESESLVRQSKMPFVIFRPSVIMGNSRTFDPQGERRMFYGYMLGVYYSILRECKRLKIDFIKNWNSGERLKLDVRLLGNVKSTKNFVCIDDVVDTMVCILGTTDIMKSYHLTSDSPLDGFVMWRCVEKSLNIDGISYVGETIDNPTRLEKNIMTYTSPFLPYITYPDPIWLLDNTNRAMGLQKRRQIDETILTGLLKRFVSQEVDARQA